jgi:methionyl-tRNA formyltransferase
MDASEIIALINACNPWNNGADATLNGEQIKIIIASLLDKPHNNQPGTIVSIADTINVACEDNKQIAIEILSTEQGIMTVKQFILLNPIMENTFN